MTHAAHIKYATALWSRYGNRVLVYDPRIAQVTIEKIGSHEKDSKYWAFNLDKPSKGIDCWDVFLDGKGKGISARNLDEEIPEDGYLIARLNLQTLGVKGRFLRKHGRLQKLKVLKPG